MNMTQLNNYFDGVFSAQSAKPMNYGKFSVNSGELVFEGRFKSGIYSLSSTVGNTRRVKFLGSGAPAEIPWNSGHLTAYFIGKMDSLYNALTVLDQASFAPEYVAAKDFIAQGKLDVAKQIVESTPVSGALQTTKDAILGYLTV